MLEFSITTALRAGFIKIKGLNMDRVNKNSFGLRRTAILGFQIILGLALVVTLSGTVFPFSMDSLFYISTAEHVVRFKGLVFSNFSVFPATAEVLPSVVSIGV